jgi:hypothetical protein
MRLRNNDDTANPLWVKAVKCGLENLRVRFFRGFDEDIGYGIDIAEDLGITLRQFDDNVRSKSVQPFSPHAKN